VRNHPFWFLFLLSILGASITSTFFPSCHIHAFAPFLILNFNRKSLIFCLYMSFLVGLFLDGFSAEHVFGINALSYCFTTLLLYPQRRNFFDDKASSIAIFTILFSSLSSLLQFFSLSILDSTSNISGKMLAFDTLIMPFLDGLYAVLVFHLLLKAYQYIRKLLVYGVYSEE